MSQPTHTATVFCTHCGDLAGVIPCEPAQDGARMHQCCPSCCRVIQDLRGDCREIGPLDGGPFFCPHE